MRNPFSEFEVSIQVNVSLAALAKDAVPRGIATRVIRRSRTYETERLFSIAHLVEKTAFDTDTKHVSQLGVLPSGNPAAVSLKRLRPVALRPALSRGLPFSEVKTFYLHRPPLFLILFFPAKFTR
jgi:hypothetical protein